jgi:ANTAR domain-containing protein
MRISPSVLITTDTAHDPTMTSLSAVVRALDTMVASTEPAVVFTSAARLCVPLICQSARVTITGPEQQAYAITWPPDATERHHPAPATSVSTLISSEPTEAHPGYRGTLTLHFPSPPADQHAILAQLVVDRATALVHRERLTALVVEATTRAKHLDVALASNREIGVAIGVIMSLRKVTREKAFDVLREVSQRTQRRLRDVADDVVETGTTEPLLDVVSPASTDVRVIGDRSGSRFYARCAS